MFWNPAWSAYIFDLWSCLVHTQLFGSCHHFTCLLLKILESKLAPHEPTPVLETAETQHHVLAIQLLGTNIIDPVLQLFDVFRFRVQVDPVLELAPQAMVHQSLPLLLS